MSNTVIRVENVSKQYRLGSIGSGALYKDVQSWIARLRGIEDPNKKLLGQWDARQICGDQFWALRDISFDVREGEVFGIVGRNGAGKSTLLKLLSRVTGPTTGQMKIRGRVASLLEVGTGFHPELTGRENVYLNGTILGMRKKEIDKKFEEIVEFAEVAAFIDTPVKRYSSGMYVRLAFAVAAHLEPEILIVDEVLAVGDAQFQAKCLGKMGEVSRNGRTVLFVSHNMSAVRQLCSRALLLAEGSIEKIGMVDDIVSAYFGEEIIENTGAFEWNDDKMPGDENVKLRSIRLCDNQGKTRIQYGTSEEVRVEIAYEIQSDIRDLRISMALYDSEDTYIFFSSDLDSTGLQGHVRKAGEYVNHAIIPAEFLNTGTYRIAVSGSIFGVKELFVGLPKLQFATAPTGGPTSIFNEKRNGVICPSLMWHVKRV